MNMAQSPVNEVEKFISLFRTTLEEDWKHKTTPRGTHESWSTADSGQDKTAQLFLKTSFAVWIAYFLASKQCTGQKHYSGQNADRETYDTFQKLSREDQQAVANALCKIELKSSVRDASANIESKMIASQPQKRPRV